MFEANVFLNELLKLSVLLEVALSALISLSYFFMVSIVFWSFLLKVVLCITYGRSLGDKE